MEHQHPHQHAHDTHWHESRWNEMAEHVELEATVFRSIITDTIGLIKQLRGAEAGAVLSVVDIGCGPGVATCELAEQFVGRVVAVDASQPMLDRTRARAVDRGLTDRIDTRLAELPAGLDGLHDVDLIWASMVLHHIGDERAVLRALRALLRPDGTLAIAEFGDPQWFLPDDLGMGRPGLGERVEQASRAWIASMRAALRGSVQSTDHPAMLAAAGLELLDSRVVHGHLDAPLDADGRRVALGHLRMMRGQLDDRLDMDDLATLDVLLDEKDARGVMHRDDVFAHISRRIMIAGVAS